MKIHTKRKHGYACTLRGETKLKRRSNEVGGTASSEGFFLCVNVSGRRKRIFASASLRRRQEVRIMSFVCAVYLENKVNEYTMK